MPPIRPRDLPDYASRGGDPSFPPPYVVDDAGMDIVICEGHPGALQRMVERALNVPTSHQYGSRHRLEFQPDGTSVGFACIDVRRLRSGAGPRQRVRSVGPVPGVDRVYAHQTEVAVMVPVVDQSGMPYWYLPYVLNGLPTAVTTGREIYGYPKQHATFAADGEPAGHGGKERVLFGPDRAWRDHVTVHAYDLVPRGDGEAEFALTPVLTIARGEPVPRPAAAAPAPARPEDFTIYPGRAETLPSFEPVPLPDTARAPDDVGTAFLHRIRSDVPYVFLRQFRDPQVASSASYQALVIGRLVPDAADALAPQPVGGLRVDLPWAYNLALAEEVFGLEQGLDVVNRVPASGLLSGRNTTFDVLRATIVWQYGRDDGSEVGVYDDFVAWRDEYRRVHP